MNVKGKDWNLGSLIPELRTKAPEVGRERNMMVRGKDS